MTRQNKSNISKFSWLIISATVTSLIGIFIANLFKEKTELKVTAEQVDLGVYNVIHIYIENIGDKELNNLRISLEIETRLQDGFDIKNVKVFTGPCKIISIDSDIVKAVAHLKSDLINPNEKIHLGIVSKVGIAPAEKIYVIAKTKGYTYSSVIKPSDMYKE